MRQQSPKKKKKLGSYPYLSVIFSITLALFVIGLFGLLLLHAGNLSTVIKESIEVQVYLKNDISDNQRIQLEKMIASRSFVASDNNEPSVRFISKEEAARQFSEDTGENILDFLGENPLRDVITFRVNSQYQRSNSLSDLQAELENLDEVHEVTYVENLMSAINRNVAKISLLLLGFAGLLIVTIIILINNTIKLALFSQRFLIRSMQLVGAKPSFIKKPFLTRATGYGLLAGILASALLYGILRYFNNLIEGLSSLQNIEEIAILFAGLLILGSMVSMLSTYQAINKYLKLSLDELY